jgi:hypothetical protein
MPENDKTKDYWDRIERRAKEIENWPEWKRGAEPAGPEPQKNEENVKSRVAGSDHG